MGWKLLAPHIEVGRVTRGFGEQHNIDHFALLEQITRVGVPVDVGPGGNLERGRTETIAAPISTRAGYGRKR